MKVKIAENEKDQLKKELQNRDSELKLKETQKEVKIAENEKDQLKKELQNRYG